MRPLVRSKATDCYQASNCQQHVSHACLKACPCHRSHFRFHSYANSIASPLSDGHLPMEYLTNSASISHMTLVMWEMEAEFGTYSDVLCHHAWHTHTVRSDKEQEASVANKWWPKAASCFFESSGLSLQPILGPLQQSCTYKQGFKMSGRE